MSIMIPNSVTNIEDHAFFGCTSLPNVTIPSSIISIEDGAFSGCTSLKAISVDANNITFRSVDEVLLNKNLTTLIQCPGGKTGNYIIPGSVTNIGAEAFYGCTKLTSITIPSSVISIADFAFFGCTKLTVINVDADNSTYDSVDGILFNKSQNTLIQCPGGKTGSYVIPSSVTSLREWAFGGCTSLTGVTIGSGLTTIGNSAFLGCTSLTSVKIPGSVSSIGNSAFGGCTSLTSVTIGIGLITIGRSAFWGCTSLTSVMIPGSVTSIGDWAFLGCTQLTSITIPSSVSNIGDFAFAYCTSLNGVYFQGAAPGVRSFVFENTAPIIYYLPGTTGWGPTFGGRPTALWVLPNPLILNNGSHFGVQANQFGFTISWATNLSVVVEACTDLAQPIWSPVGTNTLTEGSSYFSDPQWTNHPARFYRLRSP